MGGQSAEGQPLNPAERIYKKEYMSNLLLQGLVSSYRPGLNLSLHLHLDLRQMTPDANSAVSGPKTI